MKASLVSATSLAALLAFDISPALAAGAFTLGGSTGAVCVNTATTAGCTLTFYALPGGTSLGETITMTATVTGGILGSQSFATAPTGFAGGGNSENTNLPKNSHFTSTPAYTYTGGPSAGSTGQSQTANTTVASGASSANPTEVAPFTFVGITVAPIQSVSGGNAGYVLVSPTGSTSGTAGVTVANKGAANLIGTAAADSLNGSVSAFTSSNFFTGKATGSTVAALHDSNASGGATTSTFNYTFAPTLRGAASTTTSLTFSNGNNAGTNTSQAVTVTLTGTGVAPTASLGNGGTGYVLVGSTTSVAVTVTNTGNGNLSGAGTISNLLGSLPSTTSSALFSGTLTSLSNPTNTTGLLDNGSQAVSYVFAPTSVGAVSANVTASFTNGMGTNNAGGNLTGTLTGTGVAPISSVSVSQGGGVGGSVGPAPGPGLASGAGATANLGYVLVGGSSAAATVTVNNTGNGNLAGNDVSSGGSLQSNLHGTQGTPSSSVFVGGGGTISLQDSNASTVNGFSSNGSTTATFTYNFAPTVIATTTATVITTFTNSSGNGGQFATSTYTTTLVGSAVAPVNTVTLSNAAGAGGTANTGNLGYVLVNSQTATATIGLQNVGNGNLAGTGGNYNLNGSITSLTGPGVSTSGTTSVSLLDSNAGGGATTASYAYTFAPLVRGASTTPVTVSFANGSSNLTNGSQVYNYTIAGTGVAPTATISGGNNGYALVHGSTTSTVTVANIGNGNLAGTGGAFNLNGSITTLNGAGFSNGATPPDTVSLLDSNAGGGATTSSYNYTFAPTVRGGSTTVVTGNFSNGIDIAGDNSAGSLAVTLAGTGVAPINSVAQSKSGLGYLLVGSQSATGTVTIANVGDGNLAGTGGAYNLNGSITTLNGTGFANGATPPDTVSLLDSNAGAGPTTSTYNYTFAPTVRGASSAVVTSSFTNGSADGLNNAQTVNNTFTGTGVAPTASLSNGGTNGYVLVQQSTTSTVTVANLGNGNLAGTGGTFNLNGSITTLNGNGFSNGATPPDTVSLLDSNAAGGPTTSSYNYTFAPTVRGSSTTVVTGSFTNGIGNANTGGTLATTLTGTGVAPVNSVTQSPSNLGYLLVGGQSATGTVTVANVGDGNLAGTGGAYNLNGSITTLNGNGFSNGATPPDTVSLLDSNAVGGPTTSTYNYTFAPTIRGGSSAVVTSSFSNGSANGTNNAQTVNNTFAGTGVAPINSVSQSTGNVGYVLVNNQSKTASVTIANVGDGNLAGTGGAYNLNGSITTLNGSGFSNGATPPDTVSLLDSNAAGGATTSTYNYTFAPVVRGTSSTIVTSAFSNGSTDSTNNAQTVNNTIAGTGVAPINSVVGGSTLGRFIAPAYTQLNTGTGTTTVTVYNVGDGNLAFGGSSTGAATVSNLQGSVGSLTPPQFGGAGGTLGTSTTGLSDGGSQSFSYNFAPTVRGLSSTTVALNFSNGSNDSANLPQSVSATLVGTGVGPIYKSKDAASTPTANIGVSTVNFGHVNLAATRTLTLTIFNNELGVGGPATLTELTLISDSLSDPTDFTVGFTPGTVLVENNGSVDIPLTVIANSVGTLNAVLTFTTDESAAFGESGDTFTYDLTAISSVASAPEPASLAVLGAGLAGLGYARRRKKK